MENDNLVKEIAGVLFLYDEPITISKIKEFISTDANSASNISNEDILDALNILKQDLTKIGLAIIKTESKNVEYSVSVDASLSHIAKKIRSNELESDLTPASLQVVTICAYLGASTKSEISFIRGVQSSQSIRSLTARGILKKEGDKYLLSNEAMQKLGITDIKDLPEYEKIKVDFTERLQEVMSKEVEDTLQ